MTISGSTFTNCQSGMGGAFSLDNAATLTLGDNVYAQGSSATGCGSAVYFDSSCTNCTLNFVGNNVQIINNIGPKGSICFDSYKVKVNMLINPLIEGTTFVTSLNIASKLSESFTNLTSEPPISPYTKVLMNATIPSIMAVGEVAPIITSVASDQYNRSSYVDPENILILMLNLTDPTGTSIQEVQAVVTTDGVASFRALADNAKMPGTYTVSITPLVATAINQDSAYPYPSFALTIADCPEGHKFTLVQNRGACLEEVPVDDSVQTVIGIIAVVALAYLGISLAGLVQCRRHQIVKGNSFVFLTIINIGAIIAVLGSALMLSKRGEMCTMEVWLVNVGFFLIVLALLVKTSRIKNIFLESTKSAQVRAITDKVLGLRMAAGLVPVLVFLIVWTVVCRPNEEDRITLDSYISVGLCSTSPFDIVAVMGRVIAVIYVTSLAFQIRDVASTYNESKFIGLSMYNWIIFGAGLSLIAQFAIPDPTASFAIRHAANILPAVATVTLLISFKLINISALKRRGSTTTTISRESAPATSGFNKPPPVSSLSSHEKLRNVSSDQEKNVVKA
ncbi:hypothetical protein HDV00_004422 [Rhizophlyctis rosea]|nr:hypothetical protein HDV00_004422 [Rhizophlyctis rosea]